MEMDINGPLIKGAMRKQKITVGAMAESENVSIPTLNRARRGQSVNLKSLRRIVSRLRLDWNDVMDVGHARKTAGG